jgi:hypothetical protein
MSFIVVWLRLKKYVEIALAGGEPYCLEKLLKLVDDFLEALIKHFNNEIPTLMRIQEVSQREEVMKIYKEFEVVIRKSIYVVIF